MPGCIVSATTASFRSVENRRRRATPVMTSTFENVSDIGVCPGLCLGPPAKAGVRLKRGAVQIFRWLSGAICPDSQLIIIARDDETTFGILHSRFHEAWALRLGT